MPKRHEPSVVNMMIIFFLAIRFWEKFLIKKNIDLIFFFVVVVSIVHFYFSKKDLFLYIVFVIFCDVVSFFCLLLFWFIVQNY